LVSKKTRAFFIEKSWPGNRSDKFIKQNRFILVDFTMVRKKRTGQKLAKKECEVCGCNKKAALHLHHIIPRCDARSSNNLNNLACLCSNCHNLVHSGQIIIIGVYSTTAGSGRKLMYFFQGE